MENNSLVRPVGSFHTGNQSVIQNEVDGKNTKPGQKLQLSNSSYQDPQILQADLQILFYQGWSPENQQK